MAYSTDKEELGDVSLAGAAVDNALRGGAPEFEIISAVSVWRALFMLAALEPDSFVLQTTIPLRVIGSKEEVEDQEASSNMGVLELRQDITEDFKALIAIQRCIMATVMFSVVTLFAFFRFCFVRRVKGL